MFEAIKILEHVSSYKRTGFPLKQDSIEIDEPKANDFDTFIY